MFVSTREMLDQVGDSAIGPPVKKARPCGSSDGDIEPDVRAILTSLEADALSTHSLRMLAAALAKARLRAPSAFIPAA